MRFKKSLLSRVLVLAMTFLLVLPSGYVFAEDPVSPESAQPTVAAQEDADQVGTGTDSDIPDDVPNTTEEEEPAPREPEDTGDRGDAGGSDAAEEPK